MQKYNFNNHLVRIGSRTSPLAVCQANEVKQKIIQKSEIIKFRTSGDKIVDSNLSDHGGKGLFTKELDEALKNSKIDMAVHSLKDVPTFIEDIFKLSYILPRENVNDVLISDGNIKNIQGLQKNAILGTSSPRRIAQIKRVRPDLNVIPLRGNIETRIAKIKKDNLDAIIIALAGIKRLKINKSAEILKSDEFMPAAGQGIIVVQSLKKNKIINKILSNLEITNVRHQATAERATLKILEGNCNSSIATLSSIKNNTLTLYARIYSAQGKHMIEASNEGPINQSIKIGKDVGKQLIKKGAQKILESCS